MKSYSDFNKLIELSYSFNEIIDNQTHGLETQAKTTRHPWYALFEILLWF